MKDTEATLAKAIAMLELAENAIGSNLHFFTDLADLRIRQKDKDTLTRLENLNADWKEIVLFLHENKTRG